MSDESGEEAAGPPSRRVAAPDEPTEIDLRPKREPEATEVGATDGPEAASTPTDDSARSQSGVTSATGMAFTRGGAASGVTTASPLILRSEEHARALALFRLVIAAGAAAMIAVWLPERVSPGRWLATAVTGFTVAVTTWLLIEFREPERFDSRKLLFQGLCCVASILAVVFYVGIFSPTIIAMYIGIYFFGVGDSPRSGWAVFLSGALGYLLLSVGAMVGVLRTDQAVMALTAPELPSMFAVAMVCQVLFVATFWMARRSRQATLAAFERLERATRQIKKREALLNEVRAELDQERAAKQGRFTDQQVGKYAVGEIIGRGAMGEVYRAWAEDTDRAVAIKFLSAALTEDVSAVERFFREADIATRVESKHIVRVLDRGVAEGGSPFLVMELLEGADLAQILRDTKRLGMAEAIELVQQVGQALAAADESGIVHRDLKPQNLFRVQSAGRAVWKVLDFGVSKVKDVAKDLTQGAAVGTPSYMSPEQARGASVDHRADVFALGIVAYRVLTGKPAFTGADSASTLYNVAHVQPVRPSDLIKIGEDVERALALALAKETDRRFSSSMMFAAALTDAAKSRLDDRIRRDADALLTTQPWGTDVLQALKAENKRWRIGESKPRNSQRPPA
ncbi:MAG: protein kinase [Myxococcales bacterium]|nr:protein kinase [Myxococcales bacterium]